MSQRRRNIFLTVGIMLVAIVIFELVPWGNLIPAFAETNPPVQTQIQWNSPETEQLVRTACYDCHSNETVWPWYSKIAPVSWLLAHDVNEGRENLNFSTQSADQINPHELVEQIRSGGMPKSIYTIIHPAASLSEQQKTDLIAGIQASLHGQGGGRENSGGDDDEGG